MSFGQRLRELRRNRRINQRDLAERVGIDVTYLSKIENGRMPPPSQETIVKLARELEADADELLVLAKKIPEDLKAVITKSADRPDFFRTLGELTDQEIQKVKAYAEQLRQQRNR
ncbi:MAG: hypothetical protein KatS3mg015_3136 [Fimbriimonadales bacterium]|nr:MAG: hypothetical protein KatS3mg015_3136 [Fimbriimonadales bacterium]